MSNEKTSAPVKYGDFTLIRFEDRNGGHDRVEFGAVVTNEKNESVWKERVEFSVNELRFVVAEVRSGKAYGRVIVKSEANDSDSDTVGWESRTVDYIFEPTGNSLRPVRVMVTEFGLDGYDYGHRSFLLPAPVWSDIVRTAYPEN